MQSTTTLKKISAETCSETLAVYVLNLGHETKLHAHTKIKMELSFRMTILWFFLHTVSELLYSIHPHEHSTSAANWCQSHELHKCALIICSRSINLFAFIFLHSVSVLLWPCDIYYLSFLLHAVSISSALTIFQFSAAQCHAVSTCYCRTTMSTNMSYLQWQTFPDLFCLGTCAYFIEACSFSVL